MKRKHKKRTLSKFNSTKDLLCELNKSPDESNCLNNSTNYYIILFRNQIKNHQNQLFTQQWKGIFQNQIQQWNIRGKRGHLN